MYRCKAIRAVSGARQCGTCESWILQPVESRNNPSFLFRAPVSLCISVIYQPIGLVLVSLVQGRGSSLPKRTTPPSIIRLLGEQGLYYPFRRGLFDKTRADRKCGSSQVSPSTREVCQRGHSDKSWGNYTAQHPRLPVRAHLTRTALRPLDRSGAAVNPHRLKLINGKKINREQFIGLSKRAEFLIVKGISLRNERCHLFKWLFINKRTRRLLKLH